MEMFPIEAAVKKSEKTRALIKQTGLKLMRKKGYDAVTIREICAKAGVSVGAFYVYFSNKGDLLQDQLQESDNFFREIVAEELKDGPADELIMRFVHHYAMLNVRTGKDDMKVLYTTENEWFAKHRPMQQVLVEVIEKGQANAELTVEMSAQEIADMIFVFMRGCCYDWCMKKRSYNLEKWMECYLRQLVKGLCT